MMLGQVMSDEETEVLKRTMDEDLDATASVATPCAGMMHWTVWTTESTGSESQEPRCDAVLLGAFVWSGNWETTVENLIAPNPRSAPGVVLTHVRPETNPAG